MNNYLNQQTRNAESDEKMVADAKHDLQTFSKLYDCYVNQVYRYLLSHVGDPSEAQDLTSQVFLSALDHFSGYQHRGHLAAWLFTIARHKWMDYFRSDHKELSIEAVKNLPSKDDALDHEEIRMIRSIVFKLAKSDQELIYLRFVARLNFADMGAVLGCKAEAAKKRLYRLIDRLEKDMEAFNG